MGVYEDGRTQYCDLLQVNQPTTDDFATCPPSEFTAVPVTNITYAQNQVAGASGTTISTESLVCATGAATGKIHLDLTDLEGRTTLGKGCTITTITLFYEVLAQALTGSPTCAVVSQIFGAAGATGAAPTASATAGGAITATPASPPTAVNTAGQFYTASFALGTPLALNNALQRAYVEFAFPMAVGGTVHVAGAVVAFTAATY